MGLTWGGSTTIGLRVGIDVGLCVGAFVGTSTGFSVGKSSGKDVGVPWGGWMAIGAGVGLGVGMYSKNSRSSGHVAVPPTTTPSMSTLNVHDLGGLQTSGIGLEIRRIRKSSPGRIRLTLEAGRILAGSSVKLNCAVTVTATRPGPEFMMSRTP